MNMQHFHFKPTRSRNLLFSMLLAILAIAALLYIFREPLLAIYFNNQLTPVGLVLNGVIVTLFLVGMLRMLLLLWHYWHEERAIDVFVEYLRSGQDHATLEVDPDSIIARRWLSMAMTSRHGASPNHAALSQVLVADESIRGSLPKYINNILILTGVFGTIVSLSIALFGASDLLTNAGGDPEGINLVVHGMSTALSTTITAIVCYVIFGYFYLRLNNVRIRIVAAVEQITADYLMPRFKVKSENITEEITLLVTTLQDLVKEMLITQAEQKNNEDQIRKAMLDHDGHMAELTTQLASLRKILLRGFRLSERS